MTADQQERPEAPVRYRMVAKADGCYEQVAADGEWVRAVECDRLRTRYEEAIAALVIIARDCDAGEHSAIAEALLRKHGIIDD